MSHPRLIALVGATATGKTAIGEAVAANVGGVVVCADARQVYRELEIGTGKPTPAERSVLPHELFDMAMLGERVSAGSWARAATETCQKLFAQGATPVLVGGSGLYVSALEMEEFGDRYANETITNAQILARAMSRLDRELGSDEEA